MIPTVIGRFVADLINTVAMVYSFQALIKTKMRVVTMPGAAIGRRTLMREPIVLQPSMRAACSISEEMDMKVPRRSQIANA